MIISPHLKIEQFSQIPEPDGGRERYEPQGSPATSRGGKIFGMKRFIGGFMGSRGGRF